MALYLSTRRFVDLFLHTFFPAHFDIERNVFGLLREILLSGILKLHFWCPGFFSDFFPGKLCSFFVSVFWLWIVQSFSRRFPGNSIKRHSVCPEQQFEENGFPKFLFDLYLFRTFIKRTFGWFAKSSREFPKLPFRCPEEPLVWLGFFDCLYSIPCISDFEQKNRSFVRGTPTPTALSKLRSMCLKRNFDEKVFQTLLFFDHFRTLFEFYLTIW